MVENSSQPRPVQGLICPLPHTHNETVVIGHGSGGSMTHDLIENIFQARLGNEVLAQSNDAARLQISAKGDPIAVSTDSHVVSPLFFPGGDIGRLAVAGTVNDVSMLGALPTFLTAGFILEEGFSMGALERIIDSMVDTCQEADVQIVAGDTKVVEKGKADGLYINTAGFGRIPGNRQIGGQYAQPGDAVLISGTLGDHTIAVLQARGELGFESDIQSDVAPLNHMIAELLQAIPEVHVLRDPTRGGLATSLNEIACQSGVSIQVEEDQLPIKPDVRIACEMLGFDPLYLANEGKVIVILPQNSVSQALKVLHSHRYGTQAACIGAVSEGNPGKVLLTTAFGTTRLLNMLSGEILPRIC